jgi:hypothetical protein
MSIFFLAHEGAILIALSRLSPLTPINAILKLS